MVTRIISMQRHLFFIPNGAGVRVMEQAQLINALKLSDRTHNPIIAIPQCGRDPVLPLGLARRRPKHRARHSECQQWDGRFTGIWTEAQQSAGRPAGPLMVWWRPATFFIKAPFLNVLAPAGVCGFPQRQIRRLPHFRLGNMDACN